MCVKTLLYQICLRLPDQQDNVLAVLSLFLLSQTDLRLKAASRFGVNKKEDMFVFHICLKHVRDSFLTPLASTRVSKYNLAASSLKVS